MKPRFLLTAVFVFGLFLSAYAQDNAAQSESSNGLNSITVENIDASGGAVHFNLRENRIVPDSEVTDDNWDVSFQGTAILVNNEAQLIERAFDYVANAPEEGYRGDDAAGVSAIPAGNGMGWFDYDPASHVVSVIPERTIVVKTPADTYAKIEILSYYEDQNPDFGTPRFYSFRFVHQADGSRKFR